MTPVAAWYLYALVVAGLLSLAAVAAESALRSLGRGGRWAWLASMLLSVGIPVLAWAGLNLRMVSSVPEGMAITLPPIVVEVPRGAGPDVRLDDVLVWGWVVGSVMLVGVLVLSWLALRRERRNWRPDIVDGTPVMVSRVAGPAVYGLRYPDIVLPEWALKLESRVRRLMLTHESEHVRAGDTRTVGIGLVFVALAPWNLALWWQLRRLREAVELDCDTRVLRRTRDARLYGSLLIEVGQRRSLPMLGVALAEPTGFLERRIRLITMRARRVAAHRVVGLGLVALTLSLAAVFLREPLPVSGEEPIEMAAVFRPRLLELPPIQADAPPPFGSYTPYTTAPRILNPEEVGQALEANYPPLLRDAGISGDVTVWFYIDPTGRVLRRVLDESSGRPALDEAALRVAEVIRFSPARNGDRRVGVWVSLPFAFRSGSGAGAGAGAGATGAAGATDVAGKAARRGNLPPVEKIAALRDTPYTLPPRILNAEEVGRALEENYPAELRGTGIGGEVIVWFLLDETGLVQRTEIREPSGLSAVDEAALRVADEVTFSPAEVDGRRVPVWVSIPIRFASR